MEIGFALIIFSIIPANTASGPSLKSDLALILISIGPCYSIFLVTCSCSWICPFYSPYPSIMMLLYTLRHVTSDLLHLSFSHKLQARFSIGLLDLHVHCILTLTSLYSALAYHYSQGGGSLSISVQLPSFKRLYHNSFTTKSYFRLFNHKKGWNHSLMQGTFQR